MAGSRTRRIDQATSLAVKGVPWLLRRGTDLVPHLAATMLRAAFAEQIAAGRALLDEEPEPAEIMTEQI